MNNFKTIARRIIYVSLGSIDELLGRQNKLVVYTYHNIINNPWVFNVNLSKFERQMAQLSRDGQFISLNQLKQYFEGTLKLSKKGFLITFDDGYKGLLTAVETIKKYNISPIVFALGKEVYVDRNELKTKSELLSSKELKDLISNGWEIGSHGLTHAKLTKINDDELKKEIGGSKTFLENKIGKKITSFAYPHGKYNQESVSQLKKNNYKFGFTMDDGIISKKTNRFIIPRVGVMGNHSDLEFKYLASPSVIGFRKVVKNTFLSKYI